MSKIVVIGSSNIDLVVNTGRIPKGGETILGNNFSINYGGKGANQAVSVLRIGGKVSFISKIGSDIFGSLIRRHLKDEGMDLSYLYTDVSSSSGVAIITVDSKAENSIIVVPGANKKLLAEDINNAKLAIQNCEYVIFQLEIPISSVRYAVKMAVSMGKKVILNPAPACPLDEVLLHDIYLITPNETEASYLTGVSVIDEESARKAAAILLQQGVQNVVITLGAKGALIYNSSVNEFVPAYRVEAIDSTAAGDVFNGALTVALSEGKNLIDATYFACAASALSVTRPGAQSSIPFRNELNEFINVNRE